MKLIAIRRDQDYSYLIWTECEKELPMNERWNYWAIDNYGNLLDIKYTCKEIRRMYGKAMITHWMPEFVPKTPKPC